MLKKSARFMGRLRLRLRLSKQEPIHRLTLRPKPSSFAAASLDGFFERAADYSEELPCELSQHLVAQEPSFPQTVNAAGVLTS